MSDSFRNRLLQTLQFTCFQEESSALESNFRLVRNNSWLSDTGTCFYSSDDVVNLYPQLGQVITAILHL